MINQSVPGEFKHSVRCICGHILKFYTLQKITKQQADLDRLQDCPKCRLKKLLY